MDRRQQQVHANGQQHHSERGRHHHGVDEVRADGIPVEYIYAVKDVHPTCLTYVEGSAKVDGSPRGLQSKGADFARIEGSSIDWPVYPNINPKSHTFEFSYRVGADCARGTALSTTMHYSGSLGSGTYSNKGPSITVGKNVTSTNLAQ
ncbi:hypothetical protein GS531_20630 [Rhodococcus hoagii]|nr:hypothetical protein [Prescottella equi]